MCIQPPVYSETSEQQTLRDQYKFKWFVLCIEVVLFKRFQSHYIDRGIKIGDLVLSIVERYLIQCPFIRRVLFERFHCTTLCVNFMLTYVGQVYINVINFIHVLWFLSKLEKCSYA